MSTSKVKKTILVGVALALLVSCTSATTESFRPTPPGVRDNSSGQLLVVTPSLESSKTSPTSSSRTEVSDTKEGRWLQGTPCKPPCWEGVTPGVTTPEDAVQILSKSPIIDQVNISTQESQPSLGFVRWTWKNGAMGGSARFYPNSESSKIESIAPAFSGFRLNQIIETYGEPTHVIAQAKKPPEGKEEIYLLAFVYLNRGFAIWTAGVYPDPPMLESDMWLPGLKFFASNTAAVSNAMNVPRESIIPWKGFREYFYYCRDPNGNECE